MPAHCIDRLWGAYAIAPELDAEQDAHSDEDVQRPLLADSEHQRFTTGGGSTSSAAQEGGWRSIFDRRYRQGVILAIALPLLQQASGINSVIFFSSQVGLHDTPLSYF